MATHLALPLLQYSLPLWLLKRKWATMAFLALGFVGCEGPAVVAPAAVPEEDAKQVLAEPSSPTPDSRPDGTEVPQIETGGETETGDTEDGWTTAETSEDPGCYYPEGLHIEVAALGQALAQDLADCSEQFPHPESDPGYEQAYWGKNLCQHEANFKLANFRNNVIEDCFDEHTEWFHEDFCAARLGATEIFNCANGKAHTIANWDACAALRDTRYDDAIASGECAL